MRRSSEALLCMLAFAVGAASVIVTVTLTVAVATSAPVHAAEFTVNVDPNVQTDGSENLN